MAKPKSGILLDAPPGKVTALTSEDIKEIAKACGHSWSEGVCVRIAIAVQYLIAFAPTEKSFVTLGFVKKSAERFDRVASSFLKQFPVAPTNSPFGNYHIERQGRSYHLSLLVHHAKIVQQISRMILEPGWNESISQGTVWNQWIAMMTTILDRAGTPTTARNDDSERPSDFVVLVREIQKRLPKDTYVWRSDIALAKAIERARKKVSFAKLSLDELDEWLVLWAQEDVLLETASGSLVVNYGYNEVSQLLKRHRIDN